MRGCALSHIGNYELRFRLGRKGMDDSAPGRVGPAISGPYNPAQVCPMCPARGHHGGGFGALAFRDLARHGQ